MTTIRLAEADPEIERTFPVMVQLRPHLTAETYVATVRRQMAAGFALAALEEEGEVRAVAGFRILDNLVGGRVFYVDDLVTDATVRSRGHGKALLDWLVGRARAWRCQVFELDSGVQRFDAHRFYFAQRMHVSSYHFRLKL